MKTKDLHHTEHVNIGKTRYSVLSPKTEYKDSEMKPMMGKKDKGVRELESRNNKHPYIFKGRRM